MVRGGVVASFPFFDTTGVFGYELLPAATSLAYFRTTHLQVMAVGGSEGIGGIKEVGHLLLVYVEHTA